MDESTNVPEGNNKPLPVSPSGRFNPQTPSPRTPSFRNDGMYRPSASPMEGPSGVTPTTQRSSLTVKDLPEAVRSLQYRYETDIFRLSKKIENLNKLEERVDDFVTVTRDYFKDQMDAQLERQAEMTLEIAQARADASDASGTKEQVAELKKELKEIKEEIPEMRTEINELTSAIHDLTAKVDMCLTGIWDNTEEPFVAYQRRKNRELDEDIQDIGSQTEDQNRQITFLRRMFIQIRMAFDVMRHEHGLELSEDVKKILPPNPLPAHDTVPATGTVRSLASFGAGAAKTGAAAEAGPSAQTAPPAKAAPASTTAPASGSASATVTSPGSSTAKQSSIPRRSKKKSSKKSSSAAKETSATAKTEEAPAVPTIPEGIRVPREAVREAPVPLADIHPLFRPQFNEVNAPGIPTAGVPTAEPSGRVSPVEAGKDVARK